MRAALYRSSALLVGALALLTVCCRAPDRPSLLLVIVEGLRADHTSAYGYVRGTTPGLEALAREGTLFEYAFTSTPDTRAAIATLLSGRYPPEHGLFLRTTLHRSVRTLPELLRDEGYQTHAISSDLMVDRKSGLLRGFQQTEMVNPANCPELDGGAAEVTRRAVRWLRESLDPGKRFFLALVYSSTNLPFDPPDPHRLRFMTGGEGSRRVEGASGLWLPFARRFNAGTVSLGARDLDALKALYDGEVAYADAQVGEVMAALRDEGLADGTLVVLTSDRGEDLGDLHRLADRSSLWEANLRVPLVMRLPGRAPEGARIEGIFQDVDLVPTVCDLLEIPPPSTVTGTAVSHFPFEGGPRRTAAVSVALRHHPNDVVDLIMSVRDDRHRYQLSPRGPDALYDLRSGTQATANIMDSSPDHLARMERVLQEWDASLQPLPDPGGTAATPPARPPSPPPAPPGDPNGEAGR